MAKGHNPRVFMYDNQLSNYWAGFLFADGCITNHVCYPNSPTLAINLSIRDIEHLIKLSNFLEMDPKYIIKTAKLCRLNVTNTLLNYKS